MAATTLSSITYNGVTYSVGDVITINSNWYQDLDDTSPSPNNISAYISQMTFTIETIYNPEANSSWRNPIQIRVKTTPTASIGGTGMIRLSQIASGGKANFTVGTASVSAYDNRNGSYPNTGGWFESAKISWSGFAGASGNPIVNYHIYYRECPDGGNTPNGNWSGWIGVTGDAGTSGSFNLGSVNQSSSSSSWGNRNAWYQFVVIGILQNGDNTGWNSTTGYVRKCNAHAQTFNANGGSGAPATQYKFNSYDFVMPSAPSTAKTGHYFNGWSTSSTATSGHAAGARVAHSTVGDKTNTWYATWKPNQYTLTINPNGGTWNSTTSNSTAKQNYGTTKTIANPTRSGYRFTGWSKSGSGSLSGTTFTYGAGNCTLTANWVAVYKLDVNVFVNGTNTPSTTATVFDVYIGGSLKSSGVSDYNTTHDTGTSWQVKNLVINSNYVNYKNDTLSGTLTSAKSVNIYVGQKYTITYNANGGSGGTTQTVNYGTSWTTKGAICTKTGYKQTGWNTKADGSGTNYSLNASQSSTQSSNLTLYAVYGNVEQYTYDIVYQSSTGVFLGSSSISKSYGTTNTVSPISINGYTSPSSQSVVWDSVTPKTIIFTYTPITYSITYTLNSGEHLVSNKSSYTVETPSFTLGNPIRDGYKFNGWTGSNGETLESNINIPQGSYGNLSYEAHWTVLTPLERQIKIYDDGTIEAVTFRESNTKFGFYNTGVVYATEFIECTSGWKITSNGKMYFKQLIERKL